MKPNIKAVVNCFSLILLFVFTPAELSAAEESVFNGVWNSKEWRYGFEIKGSVGTVTDWNNNYNPDDPTTIGDVILTITEFTDNGFVAVHRFYDASMIDVVATLIDANTIELKGRREIWRMTREPLKQ